jgi:lysophospholipase L1-like esterase
VLGNPVFRVIGERSYGLYLFHWPVFQCLRHETGIALKPHEFVAAMIVTVAITEISYRYIELPIRERRLRESMGALLRGGPGALRRRGSFGAIVSAAVVLPVFAGVSLVTADLKQNEVQASLEEAEGSVTDVLEDLTSTSTPTNTQPSGSIAPVTTSAPPRYDVFAIGDSVMKGAAPSLADLGIVVDAQQDRQARMGAEIFQQLEDLGVTIDVAVVHLGTNGPVSQETFDFLMEATSEIPKVIVLTLTANREWTAANNAKIRALPETHPNVIVLDWQLVSELCTGECFTADRIHLDRDGMRFYAAEIWKAMGRELPSDW